MKKGRRIWTTGKLQRDNKRINGGTNPVRRDGRNEGRVPDRITDRVASTKTNN